MEGSSTTSHKHKKTDDQPKKKQKRHARPNNIINVNRESKKKDSNEKCVQESSLGVFEFPWMKESMISTSLDWSLPGSLFPVDIDNIGNEMFEEILSEVRWPVKRVSNDRFEFEAFEYIWTSISD